MRTLLTTFLVSSHLLFRSICFAPTPFPQISTSPVLLIFVPTSASTSPTRSTARRLMESAPPQAAEQRNNRSPPASSSVAMPPPHGSAITTASLMGKHRLTAAVAFLNQQIQTIQDEIDDLDTIGGVSTICPELISSIDAVPDALLPAPIGPADVGWDRWFQGAQSLRSRRRWI